MRFAAKRAFRRFALKSELTYATLPLMERIIYSSRLKILKPCPCKAYPREDRGGDQIRGVELLKKIFPAKLKINAEYGKIFQNYFLCKDY